MRNFNIIPHIINLKLSTNKYIKKHIILCLQSAFPFITSNLRIIILIISNIVFRFNKKMGFPTKELI